MRGFDEFERKSPSGDEGSRSYILCVGGYPREAMPTFAAAEARAWDLLWIEPDADFSIYEVASGIHFGVPLRTCRDDGVMSGAFDPAPEHSHFPR